MSDAMSLSEILIITLIILLVIFFILIFIKQKSLQNSLHVILENQKAISQNQDKQIAQNHDEMVKFLYEKLLSMDDKQQILSKSVHEQIQKNTNLFSDVKQSISNSNMQIQEMLFQKLEFVSQKIDKRLDLINEKVQTRLKDGFENIDVTFKQIIVGIAKINQAQKNIEDLSTQVTSLQDVLTDKKTRGIFGEVLLQNVLESIFGKKQELYALQHTLSNGFIVDACIKAPSPLGQISVDSKFPMENFRRLNEDKSYVGAFKKDMKYHIDCINQKYIIKSQTAEIAILFLPAEAIFAQINAYYEDIIDYARSKSVFIASPTTLMALLSTILSMFRDLKTKQQAKKIQEELYKLSQNFSLYKQRWENLAKHIDTVHKDVKQITTTTSKITNEFIKIQNVDLDENTLID